MIASRTTFVGRAEELAALEAAVDDASAGRPRAVLVRGEAGIGKSSLVRTLLSRHPDFEIRTSTSEESEALLAFGVLAQLWRPSGEAAQPGPFSNPHQAGSELLRQLGRAEAETTIVCVVDDIQWADGPSLRALTFALRRAVAERLLVVLIYRDSPETELPDTVRKAVTDAVITEIVLGGLATPEVSTLSAAASSTSISTRLAEQLQSQTGGNPLYVLAILDELDLDVVRQGVLDPLPPPRSYASSVLRKLHRCDRDAVGLVQAAAVLGTRCSVADTARLAGCDDPARPLGELVDAGLVEDPRGSGTIRFSHPLVRAAVYHDLPHERRAALHRRAAQAASSQAQALHHRIAAATGHDDRLADELLDFAGAQGATSNWTAAADAFTAAAALTADRARIDTAVRGAAESLMFAGQAAEVRALLPAILEAEDSPAKNRLLGFVALYTGDTPRALQLLTSAWDAARAAGDSSTAATAASDLSLLALTAGRGQQAIDWARRALAAQQAPIARGTTRAVLATAQAQLGHFDEGLAELGELPDELNALDAETVGALLGRGVLRLYGGDAEGAIRDLTNTDLAGRAGVGLFSNRVNALLHLADAEYRIGSWDQAVTHADLATALGDASGAVHTLGLAHAVAAFPAAGRGDWVAAETHIRAAESFAQANGDAATRFYVSVAEMRLELARGNAGAAAEAGAALATWTDISGVDEPELQPWKSLYAHALIGLDRLAEAERLVADLLDHPSTQRNARALARAHHVRARLLAARNEIAEARAAFEAALAQTDPADRGLDAALLHLDYGRFLTAHGAPGEHRSAVNALGHAMGSLRRLGAVPYLERCRAALPADSRPEPVQRDLRALLTSQELATATLVATGLSNREVAAELVISHKTVEYHLSNVFRKLGVSSRTMLTARLTSIGT